MEPLQVLIAEERGLVASRLAAQLESLGHWIVAVAKDRSAVESAIERFQPDLLIIGLHLPPGDAIRTTRAVFGIAPTPTILLTGYVGADLVRRGQEAGVMAYLVWPAETTALASTIRVALARFRELRLIAKQTGDPQTALGASLVVERAKRLLIRRLDLSEGDAFQYLQRQSQITNAPVAEVAKDLLSAGVLLFGKPEFVQCLTAIAQVLGQQEVRGPPQAA